MRRFSTIAIVALVGLAASCQRPQAGPPVETASSVADARALPQGGGPVKVSVTCPATDDGPGGVTVDPWTVEVPTGVNQLTWNLQPKDVTVSIDPVNWDRWPFTRRPIQPSKASAKAGVVHPKVKTEYQYSLTITCPNAQVIQIDPIVIVDP